MVVQLQRAGVSELEKKFACWSWEKRNTVSINLITKVHLI